MKTRDNRLHIFSRKAYCSKQIYTGIITIAIKSHLYFLYPIEKKEPRLHIRYMVMQITLYENWLQIQKRGNITGKTQVM